MYLENLADKGRFIRLLQNSDLKNEHPLQQHTWAIDGHEIIRILHEARGPARAPTPRLPIVEVRRIELCIHAIAIPYLHVLFPAFVPVYTCAYVHMCVHILMYVYL
jgi:hypothetical protein